MEIGSFSLDAYICRHILEYVPPHISRCVCKRWNEMMRGKHLSAVLHRIRQQQFKERKNRSIDFQRLGNKRMVLEFLLSKREITFMSSNDAYHRKMLHHDADTFGLKHTKTVNPKAPLMHQCPKCGSFKMTTVDDGWCDQRHLCRECRWNSLRYRYHHSFPNPYLTMTPQIFLRLERN